MRILTYSECADWCSLHGYPTRHLEGHIVGPEPDLCAPEFRFAEFSLPADAGRRVWLSKFLCSFFDPPSELLVWLGDWAVWPSGQHMPLFSRFREAFNEHRPLIEAPGHLVNLTDMDDMVSIVAVATLFLWNCHVLSATGEQAMFVSHNEFGWFAVRDETRRLFIEQRLRQRGDITTERPAT